jgi:homeodomain-containing protein
VRRDWRRHPVVVTPDTVVRWHRAGGRLYWRWRSRAGGGRPRLSPEVRELIARMSQENPLWGAERIRGELRKLGIVVSNRSIRRYRWRAPGRPPSQAWRTFLANHAHAIWAADLFVVQTLAFRTPYVLLFIAHGRREETAQLPLVVDPVDSAGRRSGAKPPAHARRRYAARSSARS